MCIAKILLGKLEQTLITVHFICPILEKGLEEQVKKEKNLFHLVTIVFREMQSLLLSS